MTECDFDCTLCCPDGLKPEDIAADQDLLCGEDVVDVARGGRLRFRSFVEEDFALQEWLVSRTKSRDSDDDSEVKQELLPPPKQQQPCFQFAPQPRTQSRRARTMQSLASIEEGSDLDD